jgi:hypothetical protein
LFRCDLALLNLPLEGKHLKKGRVQTVLCVHLKKGRVIEVQGLVILLKLLLVLLLVGLETSPLLLGCIHVANKCLNLCCGQIIVLDTAESSRHLSRT